MADFLMKKSLPPLNWFRAFEASARRLSFTAAAEELGMTQSAVSQQIRALETRLGVGLFVRQARGLALTDDGRKLLPKVEGAIETLSAATAQFGIETQGPHLTIASSVSMIDWVLSPALRAYMAQNPDLSLRLVSTIWPDDFTATQADLQIFFGTQKQAGPNARPLMPSHLIPVKSPDLSGPLSELPLIESVGTSDGWAGWANVFKEPIPRPSVHVDTYGAALGLAKNGVGVALVSAVLAGPELKSGTLVQADPRQIPAKEGYFLNLQSDAPTAKACAAWILSITAQGPG